jgi:sec-independent protein translocase protein TatC
MPEQKETDADLKPQPIVEHLVELRRRLIWCFAALMAASCVAYAFAPQIYAILVHPLAEALQGENRRMIYTGLTEAFMTYMRLAFFAGGFVSAPFIIYQIWLFVAPGMYRQERRAFLPFLIATPLLFAAGGAFVYFVVIPLAWKFFAGFETLGSSTTLPIQLEARVSEYLSTVMQFMFAFGICFELPVLMTLLGRAGILTSAQVAARRRHAVVGALIVAAFLTPPDVFSQLTLAIPLVLLYELSIWLMRLGERKREKTPLDQTPRTA